MRTVPILVAVAFAVVALALVILRPAAAVGLGIVGGAVGLAFTQRSALKPRRRAKPAKVVPSPALARLEAAVIAWRPDPALLEAIREAGWTAEPSNRGAPWVIAAQGPIRVALRPTPQGPRATAADIAEALSAKETEYAQHAAIVCAQRPDEAVAAAAKQSQVHLVNLARLGAYLTLAGSFRPSTPAPVRAPVHATA